MLDRGGQSHVQIFSEALKSILSVQNLSLHAVYETKLSEYSADLSKEPQWICLTISYANRLIFSFACSENSLIVQRVSDEWKPLINQFNNLRHEFTRIAYRKPLNNLV